MQSRARTVAQYLRQLPPEQRRVVSAVRAVVRRNLPKGYVEGMGYGMITYSVPFSVLPDTYNGRPFGYVALAAQKRYYALYLTNVYGDPATERWFRAAFRRAGKKLDMGKSCVRFRRLEDLPISVIGQVVARTPMAAFVRRYRAVRRALPQ